ncbi:chaperone protein DnaJ [Clostridium acetireducens DSM 10703]|jgi:molecular chaperone DnaJ|uniref:Chaperone protein DnaJ n=1 Tax=Clostridium acetireducens DSM 10703 TaxID=1121290 RepID=A0A1E8EWT6_9CLOT|nr:DnaJ domain-containing protein [Clostridium acetireducens]OFI05095.1 chaperone protein DnaJ [Clostridium acetireducens DSM 10703]
MKTNKNPYEILGLKEGASKDEIRRAYRNLAKKYHPDQYENNPLKELAEEKMREANEAYEVLTKNKDAYNYNSNDYSNDFNIYESIRIDISNRNFAAAEQKLNNCSVRNAEWNFLMGIINIEKGWYDSAYRYFTTACNLDPTNMEYRQAFARFNNLNNSYRQSYYNKKNNDRDLCNICTTLYCLDCCCECMGGDFISCC